MKIIAVVLVAAVMLTGCGAVASEGSNVGYTQSNNPAYNIIDKFTGPDGEITLFCRNGDLFIDKDGYRSGNIEFHFKHEKCAK